MLNRDKLNWSMDVNTVTGNKEMEKFISSAELGYEDVILTEEEADELQRLMDNKLCRPTYPITTDHIIKENKITTENFAFWLQGYFEINGTSNELTPMQVQIIKDHLALVFRKETPQRIRGLKSNDVLCDDYQDITPSKEAVDKLRNILESNEGGGKISFLPEDPNSYNRYLSNSGFGRFDQVLYDGHPISC